MKKFYAYNYNHIVIGIWTIFLFLLWLQYIHLSNITEASLFMLVLVPAIYLVHILADKLLPKAIHEKKMNLFIFQFIGISLLISFMLASSYYLMSLAEDAGYFPHSYLLTNRSSLAVEILFAIPSSVVINFGFCGIRFYHENIKLKKTHLETQLQVLQSQINPHFMFNVLNHIHTLMLTDVELASALLLRYSDMLRYQLYRGKEDMVTLSEEIGFIKDFIEIEKVRWGKKIEVDTVWDTDNNDMKVHPLLLISFVENAFKYASRTLSGKGFVKIVFIQKTNTITLEVENTKPASNPENEASGIGLANARQRLNLLYGDNYSLDIHQTETSFDIKLKIWNIQKS